MPLKVGILGLAQREGIFAEVGLRSWEEAHGDAVERALVSTGGLYITHRPLVIRSDRDELERILKDWCDAPSVDARCDLIFTVGGIGLAPRDVMPEATLPALDRVTPGIAELLRAEGVRRRDIDAIAGRGVAGVRKSTLIVNLPGSELGIAASMRVLLPLIPRLIDAILAR